MKEKNKRRLVGLVGIGLIAWSTGVIDPDALDVPQTWRLVVTGGFLPGIAAWVAAAKVHDLLPEDRGIFLVELRADDDRGGALYELNEDQWADLTVHGSLFEWPGTKERCYEVREYRPEENVAVGTWRETKPASELAGEATVDDAMASIRELRQDIEPDAAEARELKRRLGGSLGSSTRNALRRNRRRLTST